MLQLLCLILRCADIFHPLRPFHLHQKWALGIAEEFSQQGLMEAAKGLQSKPMMEQRTYAGLRQSTIDFIDCLVVPLFTTFAAVFPSSEATKNMQQLNSTKVRWLSYDRHMRERAASQSQHTIYPHRCQSNVKGLRRCRLASSWLWCSYKVR